MYVGNTFYQGQVIWNFSCIPVPTLTSVDVTRGPIAGNTRITVTGSDFQAGAAVSIGGVSASNVIVNSDTSLSFTTPAHAAGTVDLQVTNPGGSTATLASVYTYAAAPIISSMSSYSGPSWSNRTIYGSNLSGVTAVTFGGTPVLSQFMTVIRDDTVVVRVPPELRVGDVLDVVVTTPGGVSSEVVKFTVTADTPSISSISPSHGPMAGGTRVTISGYAFIAGGTTVTIGDATIPAADVTVVPSGSNLVSLNFVTPASGVAGDVDVKVSTVGGTSNVRTFQYVGPPVVNAISATSGPTSGGTQVVITGGGFQPVAPTGGVKFGGVDATYTVDSLTQITAIAPAGGAGPVHVTVATDEGGASPTSSADLFTYIAAPTATSLSPTSGATAGGTNVTVAGSDFVVGQTSVTIDGVVVPAGSVTVNSASSLSFTTPAHAAGNVAVLVTTPGGASANVSGGFTYDAAPTITSLSKRGGLTTGGANVTINGANLAGATGVTVDGAAATIVGSPTATALTFTTPAHAAGTVIVVVNTPAGTAQTTFTYVTPIVVSPASGALPAAAVGVPYSQTFTATGGTPPYSFGWTPGTTGLSGQASSDGLSSTLSGEPDFAGTQLTGLEVRDSSPVSVGGPYRAAVVIYSITTVASAPTINFGTLSDAPVSASPLTLSATASSGLAVSFTSTTPGVCTVSGTSLTLLTTGQCSINADQAGDASNPAAATVTRGFTVTPEALVLSVGAVTGPTVGANYSQSNTATGGVAPYLYELGSGGLPPGVTLDSATGVVSGVPTTAGVFRYQIKASDHQSTPVLALGAAVDVTIAKGGQTLAFTSTAPAAKVGDAPYTVAAAATSGLAVTYALDAASTGCALSGANVTFPATGTCVINADQAGDGNWNVAARVQQSFAVAPAALTGNLSGNVTDWKVGDSYRFVFTVSGGVPPYTFTSSDLPAGTTIDAATGVVSGRLTTAGDIAYNVLIADSAGAQLHPRPIARIAKGDQTLAFTSSAPPARVGGAAYTVSAATASGLAVSYALDAASAGCALSGTSVTFTATGTCRINAIQAGDGNWNAATPVQQSFAVGAANAVAVSLDFTPGALSEGATGALTLTFDNPNTASTPAFAVTLTAPALLTRVNGAPGGSCTVGSVSTPTATTLAMSGVVVSLGRCTVTLAYVGAVAGSASGFTLDAFAPTGYATTPVATSAGVTVTPITPPAPTAADRTGIEAAYGGAGVVIDLSGAISGQSSDVTIRRAPAHGVVTISGLRVTYTPDASYYGDDSFTYAASGPGGTSNVATVSLTVARPPAPIAADKANVEVAYGGANVIIDLAGAIAGVHSSLEIVKAPDHGVVSVKDGVVTYTPTTGYYGPDSFTYAATGPGGTSAPAKVDLIIATPPAPTAGAGSVEGGSVDAGGSLTIDLAALVTGVYDAIQVSSPPAHGVLTLSAASAPAARTGARAAAIAQPPYVATYTPAAGFAGVDSFAFVAIGPGGTSAPVSVMITVVGQAPAAPPARAAKTGDGQTISVMLTEGAVGGPFIGASVVKVSPVDAATTAIVASGSGPDAAYRLDVTPSHRFEGAIMVAYTLSNAYGTSPSATVTLTVQARPDPRGDPDIGAISDAQAETTRRFARAQVSNFMRRNEQLHQGGGRAKAMGVTLSAPYAPSLAQNPVDQDWDRAMAERMRVRGQSPTRGADADAGRPSVLGDDAGGDGKRLIGSVASWVGGAIDIGARDATADRSKVSARSSGLSGGADIKLRENLLVGAGGGFGDDLNKVGAAGARVRGKSTLLAAYASYQPTQSGFIDAMVGLGQLDFTTRRTDATANAAAAGKREGDYTVAALALGFDGGREALQWSLYGRGEYLDANLGAYAETGAGRYNLRFDAREVDSLTGTIGGKIHYRHKVGFGAVTPRLRAEWSHEFADVDAQRLDYADIPGAAIYSLQGNGWTREQVQISLGAQFDIVRSGWSIDLESGLRAARGERAGSLQIKLSNAF